MAESKQAAPNVVASRDVQNISLKNLKLDPNNPRFGDMGGKASQEAILARIVTQFGIDDVLASLSINGYFPSEPLVAKKTGHDWIVVEGNRRLAACLILAKDPRAKAFENRRPAGADKLSWSVESEVPVLVFTDAEQKKLLPYLGVRHIVGSQPWDSYAKARWIDQVIERGEMSLEEIAEAIGDSNRTIFRMLDGYRFINQLKEEGRFKPDESHKKGRGSNPEFPFSWVYSLLDSRTARDYLGLPDRTTLKDRPIPAKNLAMSAKSVVYMFGDKTRPPAINDSRQIGDLADCLADPIKRELLERGKSVDEIIRSTRPQGEQLAEWLNTADEALRNSVGLVTASPLKETEAQQFVTPADQVRLLAKELHANIKKSASSDDDA